MRAETALQRLIRHQIELAGFHSVHVPNGAVLSGDADKRARQMNALKRDGLLVGFPDLLVYGKQGRIGHIEVKTAKGPQSDNQKAVQAWLEGLGHRYVICRSVDDAMAALKGWGWLG